MMKLAQRTLHFLLVEDDDDHASLLVRHLRTQPAAGSINRVTDGVEALSYLRREGEYAAAPRPDLIVLDLNLPRMNGHELLAAIKSDEKLRPIPVVVLTTSNAETDRLRAYSQHANSYLVKPVEFDSFQKLAEDLSFYWGVWNQPGPLDDYDD